MDNIHMCYSFSLIVISADLNRIGFGWKMDMYIANGLNGHCSRFFLFFFIFKRMRLYWCIKVECDVQCTSINMNVCVSVCVGVYTNHIMYICETVSKINDTPAIHIATSGCHLKVYSSLRVLCLSLACLVYQINVWYMVPLFFYI